MKKLFLLFLFSLSHFWGTAQTVVTLTTVGAGTFTVPACVSSIKVECWGGGGAGGGSPLFSAFKNGGGGGGAYASSTLDVTSGTIYNYFIGNGGTGGTTNGGAGGNTYFQNTSTLLAEGGKGGLSAATGAGGLGGKASASIGTTKYNGGNGGSGNGTSSGGGGSSAGTTSNGNVGANPAGGAAPLGGAAGGAGSATAGTAGAAGALYGAGGGGGNALSTGITGGNGARGKIVITYTVNPLLVTSIADINTCGTLRYAVDYALSTSGLKKIEFSPSLMGTTISLVEYIQIPSSLGKVHIDGDINNDGMPDVIINGASNTNGNEAFDISGSGNTIEGLVINKFFNGISISGDNNTILNSYIGTDISGEVIGLAYQHQTGISVSGSNNTIRGCVLSGNTFAGVTFNNQSTTNNQIVGCFLGTNKTGTLSLGNNEGIRITAGNKNFIGREGIANRNIISGNKFAGIVFWDGNIGNNTDSNYIYNNYIGVGVDGLTPIENGKVGNGPGGISIEGTSRGNKIGDTLVAGRGNVIAGNDGRSAISLRDGSPVGGNSGHLIANNFFGISSDGVTLIPQSGGVSLDGASKTRIQGNIFGAVNLTLFNAQADLNIIHRNQIYGNGATGKGISMYNGANSNIQPPRLLSINLADSILTGKSVAGELVQLFADYNNEGYFLIAEFKPTTSTWTYKLNPSIFTAGMKYITAIGDSLGRSSAFSEPFEMLFGCNFVVQNANDNGVGSLRESIYCANKIAGPNTITFDPSMAGKVIVINSSYILETGLGGGTSIDGANYNVTVRSSNLMAGGSMLEINGINSSVKGLVFDGSTISGTGISIDAEFVTLDNVTVTNIVQTGIEIKEANNTLKNSVITNCGLLGVLLSNNTNQTTVITGSKIGVNKDGVTANPNYIGILAFNSSATIGGTNVFDRNIISGNDTTGVIILGDNVVMLNNYIGLDVNGAALGNGADGLYITDSLTIYPLKISLAGTGSNNRIGNGTTVGRNVISGNKGAGIVINGIGKKASSNIIDGNYIGTNPTSTAAVANENNGLAIRESKDNTIKGNIISGNILNGLQLTGTRATSNTIISNIIGPQADGKTKPTGSTQSNGINLISVASSQIIGGTSIGKGNIIAFNTNGIFAVGTGVVKNKFSGNSIFSNTIKGININYGPTAANGGKLVPVISSATPSLVSGTGTNGDSVEVFKNSSPFTGKVQGQSYVNRAFVSGGIWSLPGTFTNGDSITATAIDASKNTSEFSVAKVVAVSCTQPLLVTSTADDSTCGTLRYAIGYANFKAGRDSIAFNISGGGTKIIAPLKPLPQIKDALIINGRANVMGYVGGSLIPNQTLVIELDGSVSGIDNGLVINGSDVIIRSLSIVGFSQYGIFAYNSNNVAVEGNYIGIRANGNAKPNGVGVYFRDISDLAPYYAYIGGGGGYDRNIIVNNNSDGIFLDNSPGVAVIRNLIGVGSDGKTSQPNKGYGIQVKASDGVKIGTNSAGFRNVIASNELGQIYILNTTKDVSILDNYIGVASDGTTAIASPNNGIEVVDSKLSIIGSETFPNTIANCDKAGIYFTGGSSQQNKIVSNSIYNNTLGGIYKATADVQEAVLPPVIKTATLNGDGTATFILTAPATTPVIGSVSFYSDNGTQGQVFLAEFAKTASNVYTLTAAQITFATTKLSGTIYYTAIQTTTSGSSSEFSNASLLTAPATPVTITDFTPKIGIAGTTTVTITGSGFSTIPTDNHVWFGGMLATVTGTPTTTSLQVTVPFGATYSTISVENKGFIAESKSSFDATKACALVQSFVQPTTSPKVNIKNYAIVSGYFNNDTIADIATSGESQFVSILLGNGDGSFTAKQDINISNTVYGLAMGDLDADGDLDLVAATDGSAISVMLGAGDGTFVLLSKTFTTGAQPYAVILRDFDADGFLDYATANNSDTSMSIRSGNGDGTFGVSNEYSAGSALGPYALDAADFNGDGKLDIAIVNSTDQAVSVYLRNNLNDYDSIPNYIYDVGNFPNAVKVGDFNNDGKPDLAISIHSKDSVKVLINNGNGFDSPKSYLVAPNPIALALADFNGDGFLDISASCGDGTLDSVSILFGNNTGGFAKKVNYKAEGQPYSLTAADFNNDSRPDLAVDYYDSDNVTIFLNTCGASTPGAALDFDGAKDYVTTNLWTTAIKNFTLEANVFWKGTTGQNQVILLNGDSGSKGYGIVIQGGAGIDALAILVGASAWVSSGVVMTTNVWHHIGAVNDNGTWFLYLDGTPLPLTNNTAVPNAITVVTNSFIGSNQLFQENFYGTIDEVRIWSRPLCQAEIVANKDCEKPGNQNGLLARYDFNAGIAGGTNTTVTSAKDSVGTNNGVLNGFNLAGATSNWVTPSKIVSGSACPVLAIPPGTNWTWTGTVSRDWFSPCNWNMLSVPDATSLVVIPKVTNQPEIKGNLNIARCKNLEIKYSSGANLELNTSSGAKLQVTD